MNNNFFALYDALIEPIKSNEVITETVFGERWGLTMTEQNMGIAMATPVSSMPPIYSDGFSGLTLSEAAKAVKSWNLEEATLGLASVNAYYNTPENLERLQAFQPFDRKYTADIDFTGKTVGLIGHLKGSEEMHRNARQVYIIERDPQPGDYPDAACDYILPQCDVVIITGSSLVNKTLLHLLSLCENSFTMLVGPSVPLCPKLLDFGIDRISGLVLTDREGIYEHVTSGRRGSPYGHGLNFVLSR